MFEQDTVFLLMLLLSSSSPNISLSLSPATSRLGLKSFLLHSSQVAFAAVAAFFSHSLSPMFICPQPLNLNLESKRRARYGNSQDILSGRKEERSLEYLMGWNAQGLLLNSPVIQQP